MKNAKEGRSLRKMSAVLLVVLVLVTVGGVCFILLAVKDAREEELAGRFGSIELQIGKATDSMSRMNSYLVDILLNNPYTEQLRQAQTVNARNVAARALLSQLDNDASIWGFACSIAFYVPEQTLYASRFNHAFPYADNLALRTYLYARAEKGQSNQGLMWETAVENDTIYLYRLYEKNGVFIAAWIPCECLFADIQSSGLSPEAAVSYLLPGQPVEQEAGRGAVQREFAPKYSEIRIIVTDMPYLEWNRVSALVFFVLFIFGVIFSETLYTLWYYQRYIQRPLQAFIHHVSEYTHERQAVKKNGIQELNEAVSAFDTLNAEIKKLRIDLYEEQLALAQTKLEYYQLQIKPHFFVNCFALLHSMAQKKECQKIQTFCIKLSGYVRYLLSESFHLAPFERELAAVHDFLDIQRIRHRSEIILQEEIPAASQELKIPPLSLLTFVENAVKHGGPDIDILVKAELFERRHRQWLRLTIQDTGCGFPAKMLREGAERTEEEAPGDGHLGINNIRKRLQLLYGENFCLQFSNTALGGLVTLELPTGDTA